MYELAKQSVLEEVPIKTFSRGKLIYDRWLDFAVIDKLLDLKMDELKSENKYQHDMLLETIKDETRYFDSDLKGFYGNYFRYVSKDALKYFTFNDTGFVKICLNFSKSIVDIPKSYRLNESASLVTILRYLYDIVGSFDILSIKDSRLVIECDISYSSLLKLYASFRIFSVSLSESSVKTKRNDVFSFSCEIYSNISSLFDLLFLGGSSFVEISKIDVFSDEKIDVSLMLDTDFNTELLKVGDFVE